MRLQAGRRPDDFVPTLARFVERLQLEGVEERERALVAVTKISTVLGHSWANSVLSRWRYLFWRAAISNH
jgi:hypothetical protein